MGILSIITRLLLLVQLLLLLRQLPLLFLLVILHDCPYATLAVLAVSAKLTFCYVM